MNKEIVVDLRNVWKHYGVPWPCTVMTIARGINRLLGRKAREWNNNRSWALQGINLEIRRGETVGVIGPNGAGKSTLLKVLAGVTPPSRGVIEVQGRVFPMIELNAGIHMELTGRENIFLLGAVVGLTGGQIKARLAEIEDFCELGSWLDRPVRTYSSGMLARLGFSVAVNVETDLLLVDEVLAVGDLPFQRKCYRRIEELRKSGVTTIFVSHALRQVERLCSRVALLDGGVIIDQGEPSQICQSYMQTVTNGPSNGGGKESQAGTAETTWEGSGEIHITRVDTLGGDRKHQREFFTDDPFRLLVEYEAKSVVESPIIGVAIYTADMMVLSAFSDEEASLGFTLEGRNTFECEIPGIPMLPGVYSLGVTLKGRDNSLIYKGIHLAHIRVLYSPRVKQSLGLIHMKPRWHFPCR